MKNLFVAVAMFALVGCVEVSSSNLPNTETSDAGADSSVLIYDVLLPDELPIVVDTCIGVDDGTICNLDQWQGQCVDELCCWSCVDNSPAGGHCPFVEDNGDVTNGQCMTGRCFIGWDRDLQPMACR